MFSTIAPARNAFGPGTVATSVRVECHAPSTFRISDLSGGKANTRAYAYDRMLTYLASKGVVRFNRRMARWEGRDMVNPANAGIWFPFAGKDHGASTEHVQFSHVIAAENGGAWCPCNITVERAFENGEREGRNMTDAEFNMSVRAHVMPWGAYWRGLTKAQGGPSAAAIARMRKEGI